MKIGEKIKDYRLRNKLTLEELGTKLEMSGSYLGRIESGKKNLTYKKLEKLIEVTELDELYWKDDFDYLENRKDLQNVTDCLDKLMVFIKNDEDIEEILEMDQFKKTIMSAIKGDLKHRLELKEKHDKIVALADKNI